MTLPTRSEALARLAAFTPHMGRAYADGRNHDAGPGAARTVSALSPWVRHRLVEERELIEAALAAHGPTAAEKWISEVLWRGYFKGWLEQRPSVWTDYLADLAAARARLAGNSGLATAYAQAVEGRTGIDCFDAWAAELTEHNWLHNHARMWFASIWIFTLRLPWQLGADFFLRHLLDGDPASNTLSWRWVAGLHTRGKTYLARADNIARYTGGRFAPRGLAEEAEALTETATHPLTPVRFGPPPRLAARYALIVHGEDCRPENLALAHPPSLLIGLDGGGDPDAGDRADPVARFTAGAIADALARGSAAFDCPGEAATPTTVVDLATRHGIDCIVAAPAPVGPTAALLDRLALETLPARDYDRAIWPYATAGFFKVRERAPAALRAIGLAM